MQEGMIMAADVTLKPGWLSSDVERAANQIRQWTVSQPTGPSSTNISAQVPHSARVTQAAPSKNNSRSKQA